jgi:spermidine synthase
MAHGIETTIVEIDPVVYDFATKYFALPSGHKVVIADAVFYASELARSEDKYDYIVHDVFTGGAEPVDLFTLEFIQDLHSILKPRGVIALVSCHTFLTLGALVDTTRITRAISSYHLPIS